MDYSKEFPSKFLYLPRIGEEATFKIKTIQKAVSKNPRFNFSENKTITLPDGTTADQKKDLGYHMNCELEDSEQVLSITSLGAFLQVFKANNIQEGDTVKIEHIDKGEWKVTKL